MISHIDRRGFPTPLGDLGKLSSGAVRPEPVEGSADKHPPGDLIIEIMTQVQN
jgi:hypothetical protein